MALTKMKYWVLKTYRNYVHKVAELNPEYKALKDAEKARTLPDMFPRADMRLLHKAENFHMPHMDTEETVKYRTQNPTITEDKPFGRDEANILVIQNDEVDKLPEAERMKIYRADAKQIFKSLKAIDSRVCFDEVLGLDESDLEAEEDEPKSKKSK